MIHVTCGGQDHASRHIVFGDEILELPLTERLHQFRGPDDRSPECLIRVGRSLQCIEQHIGRRILDFPNLVQDDAPFDLNVTRCHNGVENDVRQDVERNRQILAEQAGEVGRDLPSG